MPEISEVFVKLSTIKSPNKFSENDCKDLEKFFVLLCFVTMNDENVNFALRVLFTQGGRSLEIIPPIAVALKEHILRVSLQSYMCLECLKNPRTYHDPIEWGWHKVESSFVPV